MAKVEWADAIKTVSGALTKINKKSQHAADQKMILATHRTAETTSTDCSRLYLRGLSSVTRSTKPGNDELNRREKFATIATMVAARAKSLSNVAADRAAYNAQKDQPGGKKTMKAYLWSIMTAQYEQEHQG